MIGKLARPLLAGAEQDFTFRRASRAAPGPLKASSLYVHIPFCHNHCPYCPYNRVNYMPELVKPYAAALKRELELYREATGPTRLSSVYIGGGTPTTLLTELPELLELVRNRFSLEGPVCLETSPSDLDDAALKALKACEVSLLSVGVQSFEDRLLGCLGRKYSGEEAFEALSRAVAAGFDCVNADMMFVLPGQSMGDLERDLEAVKRSGVQQCTLYPLFTFPYAAAGRHARLGGLKMPSFAVRRRMYSRIHAFFTENGYDRVSVWGFRKGAAPRYSSVTRNEYIGLGAGAGSKYAGVFLFNTFSVEEYMASVFSGRLPTALEMPLTPRAERFYSLYWHLYETRFTKAEAKALAAESALLRFLLPAGRLAGLYKEDGGDLDLTERGAFYIHLAQNYFALNYIDKVWTRCMAEPWPESIAL